MPSKPMKLCQHPMCKERVRGAYCDKHKPIPVERPTVEYDESRRGTSTERGYDKTWRKARNVYIRENPLCVECLKENRLTPAYAIDHIKPHRGNYELFWNTDNWQSLCRKHHAVKTAREDGGYGNRRIEDDYSEWAE